MSHARKLISFGIALVLMLTMVSLGSAQMTPSVTVNDQAIVKGQVVVEKVVSVGPGWIVIHAQAEGKPGPILGFTQVADGENNDVVVEIDPTRATRTLYAMLHTDAGAMGVWEFPGGPDVPVKVDDTIVTPAFNVTVGVGVADQSIADGTVTVARVFSQGPGWIVIHTQAEGKPGPIIGFNPVGDGPNDDVVVEVDISKATPTLYAMLHIDAGQTGVWEFPGPDAPVKVGDVVITPSFEATGGLPTALPVTGGTTPWALILLAVGALALFSGLTLVRRARAI